MSFKRDHEIRPEITVTWLSDNFRHCNHIWSQQLKLLQSYVVYDRPSILVSTNRLWNVLPPLNVKEWLKKFPKPNMIVLNTEYGHMTHKIFTNRHLKPRKTAPNGAFVEWKSTFVNMTWISDILELWNMEMIISFKRSEYFILMIPFQFKYLIRFIG